MTAFTELAQSHPELQKGVTQDLRFNLLVNGERTSTATSGFAVSIFDANGSTVSAGSVTSLGEPGQFGVKLTGSDIGTETVLTSNITYTDSNSDVHTFTFKYDVVGSHLFSIYDVRDWGGKKMTAVKTTDEEITRIRAAVTSYFEEYCNIPLVRRYREFQIDGSGENTLTYPCNGVVSVSTASVGGTAFTADELSDLDVYEWGEIWNPSGWQSGHLNVRLGVIAGPSQPNPAIKRAALIYFKHLITPGNVTDRSLILTDETGTWRIATPGRGNRPTGFPEVDFILNQERLPSIY